MNPFTRSLLAQVKDGGLVDFVTRWDVMEELVVRVYKTEAASELDEHEHVQARTWLLQHYPKYQAALARHWLHTRAGSQPVSADPFARLLEPEHARDFVDNWPAMQTLPSAREALNMLLIERADLSTNPHE